MTNIIYVIRRRTDLETSLATSYRDTFDDFDEFFEHVTLCETKEESK